MIRHPHVLLAEDNPDDAELTREAFKEASPQVRMSWAQDGAECLEMLRGGTRPDLILLDLNMPRMDGRETLRAIKADPDLAGIPVVILTTSEAEADVMDSYRAHANAYLVKPITIDDLIDILRHLTDFWFGSYLRRPQTLQT